MVDRWNFSLQIDRSIYFTHNYRIGTRSVLNNWIWLSSNCVQINRFSNTLLLWFKHRQAKWFDPLVWFGLVKALRKTRKNISSRSKLALLNGTILRRYTVSHWFGCLKKIWQNCTQNSVWISIFCCMLFTTSRFQLFDKRWCSSKIKTYEFHCVQCDFHWKFISIYTPIYRFFFQALIFLSPSRCFVHLYFFIRSISF